MKDEVNNWVMACDVCAADKIPQKKPRAPLGSLEMGAVLATLSTDLVGPFPITLRNNRCILIVTDHLNGSKFLQYRISRQLPQQMWY